MENPNKYFTGEFLYLNSNNSALYKDVLFLSDLGPFKRGDMFQLFSVTIELENGKNKILLATQKDPEVTNNPEDLEYEFDLFPLK